MAFSFISSVKNWVPGTARVSFREMSSTRSQDKSMASLTGILIDVSGSMSRNIGEGTDEKGGPWARSIFEVIDNFIKYDISSDNHVFAIGLGLVVMRKYLIS